MKELLLGLLGGGTLVQLFNLIATMRPTRRQVNANALGAEVAALEKTIIVLRENMESSEERYRRRVEALQTEVSELRECRRMLEERVLMLELRIREAHPRVEDALVISESAKRAVTS